TRLLLLLGDLPLSAADPVVEGAQAGRIAVAQAILGGVALLVGAGHEPGAEVALVLAGLRVLLERRAAPERHRQRAVQRRRERLFPALPRIDARSAGRQRRPARPVGWRRLELVDGKVQLLGAQPVHQAALVDRDESAGL